MNKTVSPSELKAGAIRESAPANQPDLTTGIVIAIDAETGLCEIAEGTGVQRAGRAASCLVEPEPGDMVLLARLSPSETYVLSILKRADTDDIALGNPLGGGLTLQAGQLSMRSRSLDLTADKGHMAIGELTLVGKMARIVHDVAEAVAKRLSWSAETATGASETYVRTTRGTDLVSGHVVSRRAEHAMVQEAAQAVLTATGEMRIDAKRIDMG